MYRKILAPLDHSKLSEISLDHVKKVALANSKSEVILLTVLEPVSFLAYASSTVREDYVLKIERKSRDHAQKYVDKIADRFKKEGISTKGEVVWGLPADEILQYIEKNGIDLVIMGTHGRSGISRWVLGSVADKVIRGSTIPVLIIPPQGFKDYTISTKKRKPNLKGKS